MGRDAGPASGWAVRASGIFHAFRLMSRAHSGAGCSVIEAVDDAVGAADEAQEADRLGVARQRAPERDRALERFARRGEGAMAGTS